LFRSTLCLHVSPHSAFSKAAGVGNIMFCCVGCRFCLVFDALPTSRICSEFSGLISLPCSPPGCVSIYAACILICVASIGSLILVRFAGLSMIFGGCWRSVSPLAVVVSADCLAGLRDPTAILVWESSQTITGKRFFIHSSCVD
jgi:hypothetical protein